MANLDRSSEEHFRCGWVSYRTQQVIKGDILSVIVKWPLKSRIFVVPHHLPSHALARKAPVEAYPQAMHSGRSYQPEWEEELLPLEQVCSYLAQGRWFRGVRTNGFFGLGGYQYYLGKHFAQHSVTIRFDPEGMAFICQPKGSEETPQLPVQGITKAELMGELAALQALPIYQLALPFSLAPSDSLSTLTT